MTTKEALKLVEYMNIALALDVDSAEIKKEVLQSIKEVAEKQIPKKLKGTEVARFGFEFICPNCEEVIAMVWDSVWQKGLFKQNYCHNCGQALDWEDVK